MYYYFKPAFLDDKKLMRFTGTMYYDGEKFKEYIFNDGVYIDEAKYKKTFKVIVDESDSSYKNKTLTDRVLLTTVSAGKMRLVSPKFIAILNTIRVPNVQFFDVIIKAADFELSDYKLMNIIGKYDCMDIEKSEVELDEDGEIFDLENLVLNESKIPLNQQLFLLGRDSGAVILIHENLKNAMEKAGLTGITFESLDER